MIDLQTIKSDMGMLLAELRTAGAEGEDTKHLRCPWHDDQHGSLSAFADKEGMARFKCLACGQGGTIVDARMRTAGYSVAEAIESLRSSDGPNPATRRPVPHPPKKPAKVYETVEALRADVQRMAEKKDGTLTAMYEYLNPKTDRPDLLTFRIDLPDGKRFTQARPVDGGYVFGGVQPNPLYRRREIAGTDTVVVAEGEKCVHTLEEYGFAATTSPNGANGAKKADWSPLAGKSVVIWPDDDGPGAGYAQDVVCQLRALKTPPKRIRLLDPKPLNLGAGGDVADFAQTLHGEGKTLDQIRASVQAVLDTAKDMPSPCETAQAEKAEDAEEGGLSPLSPLIPQSARPNQPDTEAFHGLAGEFVHAVEPHTEADPAALLVQFLVAFGNAIGRTAHAMVEATPHYLNEFAVLVGDSSRGRKGTSWGHVERTMRAVDEEWAVNCIMPGGLSSGEGLIWRVRDPLPTTGKQNQEDPGVTDKRLFVIESELANVLKVIERQGSTLSPVIRNAWDTGTLRICTKNDPAQATNAHISIVGHITAAELKRLLTETQSANGFGNRFLWAFSRRQKLLPEGSNLPIETMQGLHDRQKSALDFAKRQGEIRRNAPARKLWAEIYGKLAEGPEGLSGALTSRAEAHVLRLSALYALLDLSPEVRPEHLNAAFALWRYCAASVTYIFGEATGDPLADEIIAVLAQAPEGLSRTQIDRLLGKHTPASKISQTLARLEKDGKAYHRKIDTGGRPEERWFAGRSAEEADKAEEEGNANE